MRKKAPLAGSVLIHLFLILMGIGIWSLYTKPRYQEEKISIRLFNKDEPSLPETEPLMAPAPKPSVCPPKQSETIPSSKTAKKPPVVQNDPTSPSQPQQPQPLHAPMAATGPTAPLQEKKSEATFTQAQPTIQPLPKTPDPKEEYLDAHLSAIRALLLSRLVYPKMALKLRQQGEMRITFTLHPNGEVSDIEFPKSSDYPILDDAARTLIEKSASSFPKPPRTLQITLPLEYKIR